MVLATRHHQVLWSAPLNDCMRKIEPSSDRRRITNRSIVIILAGVILGLLDTSSPARSDDSVGSVIQIAGNAQIQRGGATLAAQQGTPYQAS